MRSDRTQKVSFFELLLGVFAGYFAFYDYGEVRTLETTFGFDPRTTVIAVAISVLPSLLFAGLGISIYHKRNKFLVCIPLAILLALATFSLRDKDAGRFLIVAGIAVLAGAIVGPTRTILNLVGALLLGSLVSELTILFDEWEFKREVANQSAPAAYDRGRAWPHKDAALIFRPGRGFTASD
jgi:hypothetical protein